MATITTTHKMQVPDTDLWFEPEGPLPEPHEDVYATALTSDPDGDAFRVAWLVHNEYQGDYEWDDPTATPSEWINGCFRDFRNSRHGGGQEARDTFYEEMVELVGADRVFIVDVYSHGLDHFSVSQSRWYPDRQWDVAPACILAVPPDVTNPEEWANGVLDTYSSWANGDTWLIVTNYLDAKGNVTSDDIIGGFIGREYAEQAAKNYDY